jgi:hypothetical protein|tara:strand:+ start:1658 stop:1981 length:324 start_codon:yes stop_codon:yes gene_type:complete
MKIKEFKTWEENNKIYVYVSIEEWNEPRFVKIRLETMNILELLGERKIKVGQCVQHSTIKNWRPRTSKGTWIFEKKLVDKPKKQVTLKEEKPKTTRKRRTKKASTGG